jgi:AraC-like DNA-binding protein
MNLLLLELRAARSHALAVPFPTDVKLAALCGGFLREPTAHATIDDWAQTLAMSRRAFTRLFRRETGLSFAEWRRQAAVLQAVRRIAGGEAITTIAHDLGYGSSAAFSSMFKRVLGVPPKYIRAAQAFRSAVDHPARTR